MKLKRQELTVYSGIAIIMVVWIHANGRYLTQILGLDSYIDAGIGLIVIDKIIHAAVPMFMFIAGFKLNFNRKNNYSEYFKNRVLKLSVPFFIISFFYILFFALLNVLNNGMNIKKVIIDIIFGLFKITIGYNFVYPLWYVPMYLLVVLVFPFILKLIPKRKLRIGIFLLISFGYVLFFEVLKITGDNIYPFKFFYYFLFYEIGYYFGTIKIKKAMYITICIMYFFSLIIGIIMNGSTFELIWNSMVFNVLSVLFYYLVSLKFKNSKLLTKLGIFSFPIFLFHEPLFITFPSNLLNQWNLYNSYIITIILVGFALVMSIIFFKILEIIGLNKILFWYPNNKK